MRKYRYIINQKTSILNFSDWLREHFDDSQRFILVCAIVGIACGLVAVCFHATIYWVFYVIVDFAQEQNSLIFSLFMGLTPVIGGLLVGYLIKIFPNTSGSGIPQTKAAYHNHFGEISLKDGITRFFIGTISIGTGASLGREGPTVHICSSIASSLGRFFGLAKLRIQAMVPVGFGAGIAAAFNAPISAITFVFEELLDGFSTKALFGIVVAVVVASTVERLILGGHPILLSSLPDFETGWWMLGVIPIGLMAGFLGNYFVGSIISTRAWFKKQYSIPVVMKPAIGGGVVGITGLLVFWITKTYANQGNLGIWSTGHEDLNAILDGKLLFVSIILLFAGKLIATVFSYGSGSSGGLFTPTLFIGALLGGIWGSFFSNFGETSENLIGAFALLGMGAMFASVIRCPMTSFLIIFEMTYNYSLILPLMMGNSIAYFISTKIRSVPIYDALLNQDKISLKSMPSYQGNRDWKNLPVGTIMSHDPITLPAEINPESALMLLKNLKRFHHGYPIEDKNRKLCGIIMHHEMEERVATGCNNLLFEIVALQKLVSVTPKQSIREVANLLIDKDVLQVPVVSENNPFKLLGVVTLHDIARQQNSISETISR